MQDRNEKEKLKFEDALQKLETIVDTLEKGELSLQDTIKKFDEGIHLCKLCRKILENAEMKIETLANEL